MDAHVDVQVDAVAGADVAVAEDVARSLHHWHTSQKRILHCRAVRRIAGVDGILVWEVQCETSIGLSLQK